MTFTSYAFVFAFLPLTVAGVWLLSKAKNPVYKKLFCIAASLVFYAWAHPAGLFWLILSSSVVYLFGVLIHRTPAKKTLVRKALLGAGTALCVALLCFFKYFDLASLRAHLPESGALFFIVPMGVSFFTFQFIVFLVEVYRQKDAPSAPLDFLLFAVFFPYRTMGPIMTHADFASQIQTDGALSVHSENLSRGIYEFLLGLFKKLVIADSLAVLADNGFALSGEIGLLAAWGTALAYTFQLYFDFSGYSDMASGIGRMLGLSLPQNFRSPYKSESISVFWRRWHVTLGRALTTSVYISLGGNRKGLLRTCFNLFCVMVVSGIWHGDTWNFLIWGALHGLLLVTERLLEKSLEKLPLWLRRTGTFLTVNALWVLFRAPTLRGAGAILRGMLNVTSLGLSQFASLAKDGVVPLPSVLSALWGAALLCLGAVLAFCFPNTREKSEKMRFDTKTALALALLALVSLIHMSRAGGFLYENF